MKIQSKLFLLFTGFAFLLLSIFVLLTQWSIGRGMVEYANQKEIETLQPLHHELAEHYERYGNWNQFMDEPHSFKQILDRHLANNNLLPERERRPPPQEHRPPPKRHQPPAKGERPPPRNDRHRPPPHDRDSHRMSYVLMDQNKQHIVGHFSPEFDYAYSPILVEGVIVGYLTISKRHNLTRGYELAFIEQQQTYLYLFGLGMMLIVIIFTLPLARHLVEPLKQLATNIHALTQGDYSHRHQVFRKDEFGQLQKDQNTLAKTLEQNDLARTRWLANTSHELRTPVSVLRGEIEAILDGIRDNSTPNLESLLQEVLHLQSLIDDLQQLNRADLGGMSFDKTEFSLNEFLLEKTISLDGFLQTNQIQLETDITSTPCPIYGDPLRLGQLIENLCQNSVKYAGTGSRLKISLSSSSEHAFILIEDDGPGVDEDDLPHLFEYLYRADNSRNRKLGGSGLGLAICKHIVDGHEGVISAQPSKLGGLAIHIQLKLLNC